MGTIFIIIMWLPINNSCLFLGMFLVLPKETAHTSLYWKKQKQKLAKHKDDGL
jgi:hypothetical protein